MDMTIGELLQRAAHNDPSVFRSSTLWHCDPMLRMDGRCQKGIDILRVIEALREEAKLRGISL
jgi:heterodisulfide reductase subunit C